MPNNTVLADSEAMALNEPDPFVSIGEAISPVIEGLAAGREANRSKSHSNSTDSAVASAMRDLESQIHDLRHMAHTAFDVIDAVLSGEATAADDSGYVRIRLASDFRDQALFTVGNVATRAGTLRAAFLKAWDGERANG